MAKEYLIDKKPYTWRELIKKAIEYGYEDFIKRTSVAADILRENGHTVEVNPLTNYG